MTYYVLVGHEPVERPTRTRGGGRYCTWDAAEAGHDLVVATLREGGSLAAVDPPRGGGPW